MATSTMSSLGEFDPYSETITPWLVQGAIEQFSRERSRVRGKVDAKFTDPVTSIPGMFGSTSSYSYLEGANDSEADYLGTINEKLIIASQGRVFYMDIKPISPSLEKKFANLKEQWYKDTLFLSSISLMQEHPAYQEILSMGTDAIPLILRELANGSGYWYPALKTITSHDPVASKDRGRVKIMTQSWLQWGKEQGYKWQIL